MGFTMIETADPKMKQILEMSASVACSKASILIQGECGTGKELLARYIHSKSNRGGRPFFAINCAAMPDGLIESELFGYERGAFTGADRQKKGRFEMASDSTFLLDEISEMPFSLQAKLLRAIQEGEVERLGGSGSIKVNVRLISTSNRSLADMIRDGQFRKDLYYRLNVIPIYIPPLRQRPKDIVLFSNLFMEASCAQNGISRKTLSSSAIGKLLSWTWPGNVRELQNVMERTVLLCRDSEIKDTHLCLSAVSEEADDSIIFPGMTVSGAEKILILKTLEYTRQNRTKAAGLLGISIRTLRNKINEYKETREL